MRPASYLSGFAPRDFAPREPSLWRGCVGAWCPSLGPTGLTLRDWSGRARHGTLTNVTANAAWTMSSGYCLGFIATSYAELGLSVIGRLFNGAPAVTVSAWLRYETLNLSQYENLFYVSRLNADGAAVWLNVRGDVGGTGKLLVGGRSQASDTFQEKYSTTAMAAGRWYHVAGILDFAAGRIKVFVDGVQETSAAATFGSTTYVHSDALAFGDSIGGDANVSRSFPGLLDDIRVYARGLSDSEVQLLRASRGIAFQARRQPRQRRARPQRPAAVGGSVFFSPVISAV